MVPGVQEQLEVQSLIAAHRATRIHELEEETRAQATTMGKCVELPYCAKRLRHTDAFLSLTPTPDPCHGDR